MGANLPNKQDGLDPGAWLAHWMLTNDLSKLANRTEDQVREYFAAQVQNDGGWTDASTTFFQMILSGFQNLGEFTSLIVQAITGEPGALTDLQAFLSDRWADLAAAFGAIAELIDGIAGKAGATLVEAIEKLATYLTEESPLSALNLFGQINPGNLGQVGLGSIGLVSPELLDNGGMNSAISVKNNPDFVWDGTVGHSNVGSAKTTANGSIKTLRSNTVNVTQNEELSVSVWANYSGVTATAGQNGIRLSVSAYSDNDGVLSLVSTTMIEGIASPTGTAGGWVELSGTYTVPAGVDVVVAELTVTSAVSAGTVWFDDASLKKNPNFRMEWVSGLVSRFSQVTAELEDAISQVLHLDEWQDFLDQVKGGVGGTIADLLSKIQWLTGGGLFDASKLTNASNIVNLPGEKVSGIASNIVEDFQNNIDALVNRLFGSNNSNQTLADANEALKSLKETVMGLSQDVQDLKIQATGDSNSGKNYRVDFTKLPPSSDFSTAPFDLTYLNSTGHLRINSQAEWVEGSGADNYVLARYTGGVTDTDYQLIQATVAGPPEVGASNWACARMSADKQNFVYAKGYRAGAFGLGFYAELGCYVNGVPHVFQTNIPATYNYNLSVRVGISGNPYRFQVLSGSKVVADFTDTTHVSQIGANYRGWGFLSMTGNSGSASPAPAAFVGCSDNAPVAVVGTTMRAYRSVTSNVTPSTGDVVLPANTFDVVDYKSADLVWDPAINAVGITKDGTYLCTARLEYDNVAGMGATDWHLIWYVNSVIKAIGKPTKSVLINGFGVPATSADSGVGGDPFVYYLKAGDILQIGMGSTGSTQIKGESTGKWTHFTITKIT
ncbi:minor tail protein [Mycobacterium phage Lolly9]|uniref:Minor tail protein n=1 Tax=Mycobacterium phage Lolly9 TaxID=1698711 RepID=A0A0K2FN74_9CAUD|nr:minor tail protein [Mycobacterium phage Lolly9]ALA48439.1 minor tail protein [Mycobacterium phage Lolly9]QOP65751.1 minor tail protein [Mycobacterium phage MiniLon]QOP66496.1 minor tail protein [Mycobacterium phage MiniMac]